MCFKAKELAIPTRRLAASAAQYRCLDQVWQRNNCSLCGIEYRDPTTPLSSFPGGEDSLSSFLKCEGADSFLGSKSTVSRVLTSTSADYPAQAGGVDPVVWLNGRPELQSILVTPEKWLKDPLPDFSDLPKSFSAVADYDKMIQREVQTAFLWLFKEEDVFRLPSGHILENGPFGVMKL